MYKYILSFTTHGKRISTINHYLEHTFFNGKLDLSKYHIVMIVDEPELSKITEETKSKYLDTNKVELLVADKHTGPHGKYYYAMQKYKDFPIITLDDDFIYEAPAIDYLAEYYENHSEKNNCVYSYEGEIVDIEQPYFRFFALTCIVQGWKIHFMKYKKESYKYNLLNSPRTDIMVNGFGMILYPPNILQIDDTYYDKYICEDKDRRIDDFVLCIREQDLGVKRCVVEFPKEKGLPYDHTHSQHGLSDKKDVYDYTTEYWLKHNQKFYNTEITKELSTRRANYLPRFKKPVYKELCEKYNLPMYLHIKKPKKVVVKEEPPEGLDDFFEKE